VERKDSAGLRPRYFTSERASERERKIGDVASHVDDWFSRLTRQDTRLRAAQTRRKKVLGPNKREERKRGAATATRAGGRGEGGGGERSRRRMRDKGRKERQ